MNRICTVILSVFLVLSFQDCTPQPDSADCSPVDLSAVKQRCLAALQSENRSITDFEGLDIYRFDLPTPQSDYLIPDTVSVNNQHLQGAVDRYNSYITLHNIWSWYEIFIRANSQQWQVDLVHIMDNIMGFNADTLYDAELCKTIKKVQKDLCQQIGASAFGTTESAPTASFDQALLYLSQNTLFQMNGKAQGKAIEQQVSWNAYLGSDYCKLIESTTDKGALTALFFDAVCSATSFEQQCVISLCSVGKVPGEVVLPCIRELLGSGKYSKYQFIMWLGWRSAMQYFFYGTSRDVQIADEYYNQYRKLAFLSTLRHCNANPTDQTALMILELFCSTGNIVRNGSFPNGNDAVTDYRMVFGQ